MGDDEDKKCEACGRKGTKLVEMRLRYLNILVCEDSYDCAEEFEGVKNEQ